MKTVLFLYHTSSIGGGSYCLLNILKNLNRALIKPIVLLSSDGPLVSEIKSLNIEVSFLDKMHVVPYNVSTFTPRRIKNAIDILVSMRTLKDIISKFHVDVLYCNTMMLYPYLRVAKKCGCNTIIHIREHWPEGEHSWQRNMALSHINRYADKIIAINRYSAAMIRPYGRNAEIVYDWIDMSSRYQKMPLCEIFNEMMEDKKVFLYMGGMQEIKGALEIVTAFSKFIKDSNSRLLILGINSKYKAHGFRGMIKKMLKIIGIKTYSERVIDIINNDTRIKCIDGTYNIRHLYEQVYCILSYFTKPHANLALAESIICNTVNIAAITDESLEYSAEGELALLYEENNFTEFLKSIESLEMNIEKLKSRISEKSSVLKYMFNPERNIQKLNRIIENI